MARGSATTVAISLQCTHLFDRWQGPTGRRGASSAESGADPRLLAAEGREAFYEGEIARQIVQFSQENDGFFTLEDFRTHTTEWVEPISMDYRGYTMLELPPNGQGITALIAFNILEGFDLAGMEYGSAPYYHLLIEATKQAFADRNRYVADPLC